MESWKQRIMKAKSIDGLCEALNEMEDFFRAESTESGQPACVLAGITENELCELPTFGGEDPADTQGIWSWDEDSLLVCDDKWEIVPR